MKIAQTFDAPDEVAKLTPDKKSPPVSGRDCILPFTFSQTVQFAMMGSFNSSTPPVFIQQSRPAWQLQPV